MIEIYTPHSAVSYSFVLAEPLETRRLLSAAGAVDGPIITGETFIGPINAMTAVVLQFNQHLDPATANNLKAYHIGRNFGSSDDGGFDPLGFLSVRKDASGSSVAPSGKDLPDEVLHPDTALGTAAYDDATETVTITSAHAFRANVYLRFIRVAGNGPNAVRNSDGIALDGAFKNHPGTNAVIRYGFHRTNVFSYTDAQKNHVSLKLSGAGQMIVYVPRHGNPAPIVNLFSTSADSSILTGTIKPSKNSDGTTTLQELNSTGTAQIELPSTFTVSSTQP